MERKSLHDPVSLALDASLVSGMWTAKTVGEALRHHFLRDTYATQTFRELELEPHHDDDKSCRRADMMTIFLHGSNENCRFVKDRKYDRHRDYQFTRLPVGWRVGFEIKVSRGDLVNDIKQRWKQNPLARLVNEIYLVCPRGLIKWKEVQRPGFAECWKYPDVELPWRMGVIEVYKDERPQWLGSPRAQIIQLAGYNPSPETPLWFVHRLLEARKPWHS